MNKHTMSDLYQMQSLPLSVKIRMTQYRIREWVDYYGMKCRAWGKSPKSQLYGGFGWNRPP